MVAVSHEGGTHATNDALAAAAAAGAATALITVGDGSPGASRGGHRRDDRGAGPELVPHRGLPVAAHRGHGGRRAAQPAPRSTRRRCVPCSRRRSDEPAPPASPDGSQAAIGRSWLAGGADHASARELALKLAEGAHLPTMALPVETILHGHLAAADARTGIVVILVATAAEPRFRDRALDVLRAAGELGHAGGRHPGGGRGRRGRSDLTPPAGSWCPRRATCRRSPPRSSALRCRSSCSPSGWRARGA